MVASGRGPQFLFTKGITLLFSTRFIILFCVTHPGQHVCCNGCQYYIAHKCYRQFTVNRILAAQANASPGEQNSQRTTNNYSMQAIRAKQLGVFIRVVCANLDSSPFSPLVNQQKHTTTIPGEIPILLTL